MSTETPASLEFRFASQAHVYIASDTGEELAHITGMLEQAGYIDRRWYTDDSSDRGTAVHRLTADFDLGALDVDHCTSLYRGYLLSHVAAMKIIRPTWTAIEEPLVHPVYRFGGRPDRVGAAYGLQSVLEGKSGPREDWHEIQTALQAILVAPSLGLPAESLGRFALYWQNNGKFKLLEHKRRADFDQAHRIIKDFARAA